MTFRDLVKRFRGVSSHGADAVLINLLDDYCVTDSNESYYSISGFLWGLVGSGYISIDERSALMDDLLREDFEY